MNHNTDDGTRREKNGTGTLMPLWTLWNHWTSFPLEPVWVGFLLLVSRKQPVADVVLCLECLLKGNAKTDMQILTSEICGNKGRHTCLCFYPRGQEFAHPYFCIDSTHSRSETDYLPFSISLNKNNSSLMLVDKISKMKTKVLLPLKNLHI